MTVSYLTTRPLPGPPYTTSMDATQLRRAAGDSADDERHAGAGQSSPSVWSKDRWSMACAVVVVDLPGSTPSSAGVQRRPARSLLG